MPVSRERRDDDEDDDDGTDDEDMSQGVEADDASYIGYVVGQNFFELNYL